MFRITIAITSLTVSLMGTQAAEANRIADFTLSSHRGLEWSLADVADSRLVVVAFLGTECPLARLYGPRLQQLHEEFSDAGVTFVGINANTQDSLTELTAYVTRHDISFPMLKDVGNRVADQFAAERTPEVFVLDQDRNIRYRGRIDDQYLVGLARDHADRRDLAIAIEELLAGKEVSVARTTPMGCHIGRIQRTKPHGTVTYSNQIAGIFNARCVECHRSGQVAPFTLTSYEDAIGWEETILEVIADNRMPPWLANPAHGKFSNDSRLSDEEKDLIRTWIRNGMPEGDPQLLPEPPSFADGWRMQEPDQVIKMRDRPFRVPAEGVVDYQYFVVDPGWTEDKYVCAAEARPDNAAVVHHIIAYVVPPGADPRGRKSRGILVGYAPGSPPQILDEGTAMHVPAGSKLRFEMHYTPNGETQDDLSYIGLKFMDGRDVKKRLRGGAAINPDFVIPPHVANHTVTAHDKIRQDSLLLTMSPHMHVRGKSFRYEALYPDGRKEILLDVPKYDFNWQLTYKLAEPKLLPRGTILKCTADFDNSTRNPVNPDPDKTVHWGDQSWEEMMIGFYTTIRADRKHKSTLSRNQTDFLRTE